MTRPQRTAILLAALLLGAGAAAAIPPDRGEDGFFLDVFLWDCGEGFLICEVGDWQWRWTLFYFQNGDPKKYIEHGRLDGGIYECADPENILLYNPLNYTWINDPVVGEISVHGVWALITVPGHGQIFKDVGTVVWDIALQEFTLMAGEHEYWNDEFDVVCAHLMDN